MKKLAVIMAKEPVPGKVKTRFCPPLTPAEAADLYRCFLQDLMLEMEALADVEVAIAYTPARAEKTFLDFRRKNYSLFAQQGNDLGTRMYRIFKEKLTEGYAAVTIIGSDCPDLPNRFVQMSFDILLDRHADVVFGPSLDGGYYLVGMKKNRPSLFADIPWSTEVVLSTTLEKAAQSGIKVELLPAWSDLDSFQSLLTYFRQYTAHPCHRSRTGKITFSYLSNLNKLHEAINRLETQID